MWSHRYVLDFQLRKILLKYTTYDAARSAVEFLCGEPLEWTGALHALLAGGGFFQDGLNDSDFGVGHSM